MENQEQKTDKPNATQVLLNQLDAKSKEFAHYKENPLDFVIDIVVNKNTENVFKLLEDRANLVLSKESVQSDLQLWKDRKAQLELNDKATLKWVKDAIKTQIQTGKNELAQILQKNGLILNDQNKLIAELSKVEITNPHVATRIANITVWLQGEITKTQKSIANANKSKNDLERIERTISEREYLDNTINSLTEQIAIHDGEIAKLTTYIQVETEIIESILPKTAEELHNVIADLGKTAE